MLYAPPTPPDFSPASTAALVAVLQGRTDNKQFAIVAQATSYQRSGTSASWGKKSSLFPPALLEAVRPQSPATATMYSWQAVYRGFRLSGYLVADSAQANVAQAVLAQQAMFQMNVIDLRYAVNPTPNPMPDVAGVPQQPG